MVQMVFRIRDMPSVRDQQHRHGQVMVNVSLNSIGRLTRFIQNLLDTITFSNLFPSYTTLTITLEPPACLDDNTLYSGTNIEGTTASASSSSVCQQRCQKQWNCSGWSFAKGSGECFLKWSLRGKLGNNHEYVSGHKNCDHVSIFFLFQQKQN